MTDEQKMLTLAAKAAGYVVSIRQEEDDFAIRHQPGQPNRREGDGTYWAPHKEPCQALELSAALYFTVEICRPSSGPGFVITVGGELNEHSVQEWGNDEASRLAATCLAITRAAAAVGEAM